MRLCVINPNSSKHVTEGIRRVVAPLVPKGVSVDCLTIPEGPPGIETDAHVADAAGNVGALVEKTGSAAAHIVACFSDPGVAEIRTWRSAPVLGIRESAVEIALERGTRFGVIAIGAASVRRHLAAFETLGVMDRLAGDRPLGLSVTDLADRDRTEARMIEVAKTLRDTDGADVLILGCAGMPDYETTIAAATGLPVIEPCQAAVELALRRIYFARNEPDERPEPNAR